MFNLNSFWCERHLKFSKKKPYSFVLLKNLRFIAMLNWFRNIELWAFKSKITFNKYYILIINKWPMFQIELHDSSFALGPGLMHCAAVHVASAHQNREIKISPTSIRLTICLLNFHFLATNQKIWITQRHWNKNTAHLASAFIIHSFI